MSFSGKQQQQQPSPARMVQRRLRKAGELEKLLLNSIQTKGIFDQNAQILLDNIRELYVSILLEDQEFAEVHEVEQFLWRLHHKRIEEFRAQIRKSLPVSSNATVSMPPVGDKKVARREPNQKILAIFRNFLSEATGFYHDLILKIRAKHGLPQDDLTSNVIETKVIKDEKSIKRCQLSCHRCLIYLGDLARYKEIHGDSHGEGDAKNHDWSIAAGFYVKAAFIWPASGNPHNQLAVMATYMGDELLAVYHYFRSLAAEAPFFTAKDNLVVLFEKNRQSYLRLSASSAVKPLTTIHNLIKVSKSEDNSTLESGVLSHVQNDLSSLVPSNATDILRAFRIHVVRVNGILFTRTSLETFPEVHSCVLSELEQLLAFENSDTETLRQRLTTRVWGTGPNVILQLISILIFSVHNVNVGPGSHQPTYAEILQQSVILEHAFIALFEYTGHLLQHSIDANDASITITLPSVLVVMEWLSCRPEMALGVEIKEKEGKARMFFWMKCVGLLNKLLDDTSNRVLDRVFIKDNQDEGVSLWEDHELRGFIPLVPIQEKLDFTKRPSADIGNKKEMHARIDRVIQAGKVISDTFKGTKKGICYDAQTDRFYLSTDKIRQESKQDGRVLKEIIQEPCVKPVLEPKVNQAVAQVSSMRMGGALGEDEDEEVIVFQPSIKITESVNKSELDSFYRKEHISNSVVSDASHKLTASNGLHISGVKPSLEIPSPLLGTGKILPEMLPEMVPFPPASVEISIPQSVSPQPKPIIGGAPGFTPDASSIKNLDSNPKAEFGPSGQALSMSSTIDSMFNMPRSGYDNHLSLGPIVDWKTGNGFGIFQHQQPWSSTLPNINCEPQNLANSPFWNSERNKLSAFYGPLGVQPNSLCSFARPSSLELPASLARNMIPSNDKQNIAENSSSVPPHVVANSLPDGGIQSKLASQVPNNIHKDNIPGALQDLNLTSSVNPNKTSMAVLSDREKAGPVKKSAGLSSAIRPPPGFGPLPVKPNVPLSSSSVFHRTLPTQLANITVSSKGLLETGASSEDGQVDDYGWLDGYSAQKQDLGQVKTVGNSDYGQLPGNTVQAFPGMRLINSSSPHSFSSLQLQQESLKKLQISEQYQQQILQEHQKQQLHQLYNARLASQWNQQQHQQQYIPPPEHALPLQRQMSPSIHPAQNSNVS